MSVGEISSVMRSMTLGIITWELGLNGGSRLSEDGDGETALWLAKARGLKGERGEGNPW